MKRQASQRFKRLLIFDFVRHNRNAFIIVFAFAALLGIWFTNEPVSSQIVEGRFVRWSAVVRKGPPLVRVFVDLPGGRTTMVEAWNGWQPPPVDTVIRLQEHTLLWFGKSYTLAPPQISSEADGGT